MDSDLVDEKTRAELDVNVLERKCNLRPDDEELAGDLEAARIHLEETELLVLENSVEFKFRALGGDRMEKLTAEHQATPEQWTDFKRTLKRSGMSQNANLPYNHQTFPPALISESCISPVFTLEQAQELWDSDSFSQGERAAIFQAAWSVNAMIKGPS
jgi:hypothetical protein